MKKKIIYLLSVLLIVCCSCGALVACDIFGGGEKNVDITLIVDDATYNYTVSTSDFTVPAHTKSGYYLLGYFDSPTNGTKFIDGAGKAVTKWNTSNPTTLYAQWKSADGYNRKFTFREDDALEYQDVVNIKVGIPAEEATVILGNRDARIEFEVSFMIKRPSQFWGGVGENTQTGYKIQIRDKSSKDNGSEVYGWQGVTMYGPEWASFKVSISCKANVFKVDSNGSVNAYVSIEGGAFACYNYIKDIHIEFNMVI